MTAQAAPAKGPMAAPAKGGGDVALWKFLVPVAIGVVLWFLPPPDGLPLKAWQMFAVFVATIAGIITAPLPMSVVAIIGATVAALAGVVSFDDVVKSTGTDLVWLILLAFFISRGVIKTGLGRRIALLFMRLLGKRTIGLGYGLGITELIVAPAMPSITARAGGVMLPITRAISEVLGSKPNDESRTRIGSYLILCAFHANIITAGMFVTAMAGNPLAVKLAADQGVKISWTDWAIATLVPGLLCLALIPVVLLWIVRPQVRQTPDATALAQRELDTMGPISANEIKMALLFVGLLLLWIFGEDLDIGASLAAAIGVSLMFVLRVLTWQDALEEKSAWDTMIWIALLIMLAGKLNQYGMVKWFGQGVQRLSEGHARACHLHAGGGDLPLRPLLLRQRHGPHQRAVSLVARAADRRRRTGVPRGDRARRPEQHQRLPDPVRHRLRTGDVRRGLRHPGRVVEGRVHHERHLPRHLDHDRSAVVAGARTHLTRAGSSGRRAPQ